MVFQSGKYGKARRVSRGGRVTTKGKKFRRKDPRKPITSTGRAFKRTDVPLSSATPTALPIDATAGDIIKAARKEGKDKPLVQTLRKILRRQKKSREVTKRTVGRVQPLAVAPVIPVVRKMEVTPVTKRALRRFSVSPIIPVVRRMEVQPEPSRVQPEPTPTRRVVKGELSGKEEAFERRIKDVMKREQNLQTFKDKIYTKLRIKERESADKPHVQFKKGSRLAFVNEVGKAFLRLPVEVASLPVFVGGRMALAVDAARTKAGRQELKAAAKEVPGEVGRSLDPRTPSGLANLAVIAAGLTVGAKTIRVKGKGAPKVTRGVKKAVKKAPKKKVVKKKTVKRVSKREQEILDTVKPDTPIGKQSKIDFSAQLKKLAKAKKASPKEVAKRAKLKKAQEKARLKAIRRKHKLPEDKRSIEASERHISRLRLRGKKQVEKILKRRKKKPVEKKKGPEPSQEIKILRYEGQRLPNVKGVKVSKPGSPGTTLRIEGSARNIKRFIKKFGKERTIHDLGKDLSGQKTPIPERLFRQNILKVKNLRKLKKDIQKYNKKIKESKADTKGKPGKIKDQPKKRIIKGSKGETQELFLTDKAYRTLLRKRGMKGEISETALRQAMKSLEKPAEVFKIKIAQRKTPAPKRVRRIGDKKKGVISKKPTKKAIDADKEIVVTTSTGQKVVMKIKQIQKGKLKKAPKQKTTKQKGKVKHKRKVKMRAKGRPTPKKPAPQKLKPSFKPRKKAVFKRVPRKAVLGKISVSAAQRRGSIVRTKPKPKQKPVEKPVEDVIIKPIDDTVVIQKPRIIYRTAQKPIQKPRTTKKTVSKKKTPTKKSSKIRPPKIGWKFPPGFAVYSLKKTGVLKEGKKRFTPTIIRPKKIKKDLRFYTGAELR